jgi:cytochrome P450
MPYAPRHLDDDGRMRPGGVNVSVQENPALFSEAFNADPHPVYAALRRSEPVHRVVLPTGVPVWLVTRYDDGRQALGDPRLSKAIEAAEGNRLPARMHNALTKHMLATDPPDHTRLRRLVSRVFTARRTEALRPRIQEITDGLLDEMAAQDRVDLIDAFAFPLPIQVICELLGIPAEDRDSFRAWSNIIVAGAAAAAELPGAAGAMVDYIERLLEQKRAHPADDLLSGLLQVREEGDQLTHDELISMVFLLLVAGHETTVNLIGNSMYVLFTRPEQRRALAADPGLLPGAIEEFLRFESPVETATFRVATAPLTLGGAEIAAGDAVLVSLLSGNRDPARFADPDVFDPGRTDNQHLAFGHGIHYCLGAPLARLEAHVGLGSLLRRFPDISLDVPPENLVWRSGLLLRGLLTLPVHLT